MTRQSPELARAYEVLEEALKEVIRLKDFAEGPNEEPMMITDWVCLVAQQGFTDEGEGVSGIAWILRGGDMPWYRIIGVVRGGLLRLEHNLVEAHRDDD